MLITLARFQKHWHRDNAVRQQKNHSSVAVNAIHGLADNRMFRADKIFSADEQL